MTTSAPRATSRTSGGSARCSTGSRGSAPISHCAAPTSAWTSATSQAPSPSRRLRTTHSRGIPTRECSPPGGSVSTGRISSGQTFGLTPAELRLVGFLPTHLSLQEIADRVYLSRATVKTHVASIYHKLGVPGRSEAVETIDRVGLGSTRARSTPAPESD